MKIMNAENLSKDFIWEDSVGLITKMLGAAGESRFG